MRLSITEALPEVKLLEKRIADKISESKFVGVTIGTKGLVSLRTREDFDKDASASYQSVTDLIKRRNLIKSLIVQSNATTIVKVGMVEMTVAEAIERKNSIGFEKLLLQEMKDQLYRVQSEINSTNRNVQAQLDKQLEALAGKEAKANVSEYEGIINAYREKNEAKLVDPLNLQTKISALQETIEDFELHVDTALSKSNTLTEIEIPD